MQFTTLIASLLAASIVCVSAQHNATAATTGTASISGSGTGSSYPTSSPIDNGAAGRFTTGSALGLVIAGGVALAL